MNFNIESKLRKASKIIIISSIFIFAITIANYAYAEPCTGTDRTGELTPYGCDPNQSTPAGDNNTNNTPAGDNNVGSKINTGIKNPLGDRYADIPSFIEAILNFFLLIGIPIITLAIIYCGFLFVTAVGNSEKLKKAKQALIYTLIGAALLLGSLVIARAIKGTVDEIKAERVIKYI